MAKFPFTNFFDVNGNGKMDFSEELLAMKVFEDALSEDGTASYDELDSDLDGLDDTGPVSYTHLLRDKSLFP